MSKRFVCGAALALSLALAVPALAQDDSAQVDRRLDKQEQRIEKGEQSGRLGPAEAKRLEKREAKAKAREQRLEKRDGSRLTRQDQARLNRQLNKDSRAIARKKHNERQDRQ